MRFQPNSIKSQEFNKAMRGYDREEVKSYLEALSNEFEILINENEKLKEELKVNSEEIDSFKKLEKTLQATLISAQESSSKAVESARKQNQLIIKEAEIKANQIIGKANKEAAIIRDSVLRLREEKILLLAKLKAMVDTQANIIDFSQSQQVVEKHDKPDVENNTIDDSDIDVENVLEKLL